jgi:hypothetical protein
MPNCSVVISEVVDAVVLLGVFNCNEKVKSVIKSMPANMPDVVPKPVQKSVSTL